MRLSNTVENEPVIEAPSEEGRLVLKKTRTCITGFLVAFRTYSADEREKTFFEDGLEFPKMGFLHSF